MERHTDENQTNKKKQAWSSGLQSGDRPRQNNISVMLSRSSKVEHYNGLGGVCEGGSERKRGANTDRQTDRQTEREVAAWKSAI